MLMKMVVGVLPCLCLDLAVEEPKTSA